MVLIIKRRVEEVQFIATILVMNDNGEIEELSQKPDKIEAREETGFTFVSRSTTEQELEWTETLGNKIKLTVGPPSDRAKSAKDRAGH